MKKLIITSCAMAAVLCGSHAAQARLDVGINLGGPVAYEPAPAYFEEPEPAYVIAPRYDRYNRDYHYDRRWHDDNWHHAHEPRRGYYRHYDHYR